MTVPLTKEKISIEKAFDFLCITINIKSRD